VLKQCESIGVSSGGIILVAGAFMGAVLGYQFYVAFRLFNAEALLGGTVGVALFRELAPVMTAIMVIASIAGALVACGVLGMDSTIYWTQYAKVVDAIDLVHCTTKGATFGMILTLVGCFNGYRARGGASAVGLATRNSVVASCLAILLADYILTSFLPFGYLILKVES